MNNISLPSSRSSALVRFLLVFMLAALVGFVPSASATSFVDWATSFNLQGNDALPDGNPDQDPYVNALEYAFGSSPLTPNTIAELGPSLTTLSNQAVFAYRVSTQAGGVATFQVVEATNLISPNWIAVTSAPPIIVPVSPDYSVYYQPLDTTGPQKFFKLLVTVPYNPEFQVKVLVGTDVGDGTWDGVPVISQVWIRQQPSDIAVVTTNGDVVTTNNVPNLSKYPEVVGTSLFSATPDYLSSLHTADRRLPLRSWLGWFAWANGTPPPGLGAGYPISGAYDTNKFWDFFSFQFSAKAPVPSANGSWNPVRLDQQPLYLNPFRVNYMWPPGQFGYVSQPLLQFGTNQCGYWAFKRIVRGPNLSYANPFFIQYANRINVGDTPEEWRDSWFYMRTRPLETLLVLPGNLKPDQLLQNGLWNFDGTNYDPFPYPMWNTNLAAADQTPFSIQVDRQGDWDADLIWEGTQANANGYATNRYRRTAFSQPGQGNYLKMTVAQGSPFIWCETHNNRYVNFYNLIRQNLKNNYNSNVGTGAKMVPGGPWAVPGVSGVNYVLFYGDHNNPNQWYHEINPPYFDVNTGTFGGFNPAGMQHNFTYTALFYRTNAVQPVSLGTGGTGSTQNNGTDAQGNPYFYLQFNNTGKNYFVIGSVPVMRYYHTGVQLDAEPTRIEAAKEWANVMGKYAFNFLTGTKITYAASNMDLVNTTFTNTVKNPYVAAGDSSASSMTANANETVMALMPHQYQPLTLGPDLTQKSKPEVVWSPLKSYDMNFPAIANPPPNANKNNPTSTSRWTYWGPRGSMKTIITGGFVTQYPFQNFLPTMPPPQLSSNYTETGVQVLNVTGIGTGYSFISNAPNVTIHMSNPTNTSTATFLPLVDKFTGRIQQIDVGNRGSGYPVGNPPDTNLVWLTVDPPATPAANGGRTALARLQIGGDGQVLAVFMNDNGAGYVSTISVTQSNRTIDPPVILPTYDANGNLMTGAATIISGGAGFDFTDTNNPPVVTVVGTGTGATAQIVQAGQLISAGPSLAGGFTSKGPYPATGDPVADAARVVVHIPPPGPSLPAQTARVSQVMENPNAWGGTAMIMQGQYDSQPEATFVDDNGQTITNFVNFGGGKVINVSPQPHAVFKMLTPKNITFTGGNPSTPAQAIMYPAFTVEAIELTPPFVEGYQSSPQISFSGGLIVSSNITLPTLNFTILPDGTISTNVQIANPGSGLTGSGVIRIVGGKGYDALLYPLIDSNGTFQEVKVLRPGSNYPTNIFAVPLAGGSSPASFSVVVNNGAIVAVNVLSGGQGYGTSTTLGLSSKTNGPVDQFPAKGTFATYNMVVNDSGGVTALIIDPNNKGSGYIPGSENKDIPATPAAYVTFSGAFVAAVPAAQASGFIATVVSPTISVDQVNYDSLISQFRLFGTADTKPWGGSFGGLAGPDGYGLGNQLSAAAKFTGVLFNYQQHYAKVGLDQPLIPPSGFAFLDGNSPSSIYELPIYQTHSPMFTLSGALETSVQAMERTLSLLHQDPPYHNNPGPADWQMDYFSQYDVNAGRIVINPTGTSPVLGVVSRVNNPPPISMQENAGKTGLQVWQPGMLWSGFGVSDQWNDQHYFYGYYLSTAALCAIFDQAWSTNIIKPAGLWSDPGQMGTAADQWLMTLAYDPDNLPLVNSLYHQPEFTYQKFAFFDQWSGHGWATGVSPGRSGAVEDGKFGALKPWSIWLSHGTGSGAFDDENENSIWEGLQPWSAIVLWGGGTDRRPLVDLGMYLLATGNAAGDLYFHDKNYNLPNSASNQFSWVPVTTIPSNATTNNGGNNNTPVNTGFVETTPPAFYTAPEAFGGQGSAGTSILEKGSPSLNNFFYAFPTGSKFIQSFPPSPWTLGMTRNTDYMKRWAGSMMQQAWADARNSSLYQPANWLSMSMAAAVCGVPYNPGDTPYPMTGTTMNSNAPAPYVERLWSSWVSINGLAGQFAARQPTFTSIEVLDFLHSLQAYGTPDWTYVAKATTSSGAADNSIVFTAAFSKQLDANTVQTTFVAFNPGWQTRYASFYRMGVTGTIPTTPVTSDMPLTIGAKKMVVVTKNFPAS